MQSTLDRLFQLIASGALCVLLTTQLSAQDVSVMLETLKRLKGADLEAKPAIKQAVFKVLEQVRDTPSYVELVRDFNLKDEVPGLIQFAKRHPSDAAAVDALRAVLGFNGMEPLGKALRDPAAVDSLVDVLAKVPDPAATPLLLEVASAPQNALPLRKTALDGILRTQSGAEAVLQLARTSKLPADLKLATSQRLQSARWPEIKKAAAELFPAPSAKGDVPLPPVTELVKRQGDPTRGAAIFRRPDVHCIGCHQVRGEGIEFGPALSEIGSKLGKDALYESILDPSNGISFGFEAWQIVLKDDEEAFGLIASETETELALKIQGGATQKIRKSDIARREKQAQSIMPAGLQANLTDVEFVDLVEYLSSLRKP